MARCSRCGQQLRAPTRALAVRCNMCQAVTRIQPPESLAPSYGQVVRAPRPGRFNGRPPPVSGYPDTVPNMYKNNMAAGPVNNGSYPGAPGTYVNDYMYGPGPRPSLSPPSGHGRRRALLIGISYNQTRQKLSGSVNDVKRMRFLLVETLGFPTDCILTLTEEEMNPRRIPTKQNIRSAMRWLVQDCQPGDSLVIHYSGHGKKQKDYNQDEVDGFDETICPLDHETEGPIIDDEINETIVRPLPRGAKLHAIIDTCYSGTVLDLPFLCRMNSTNVNSPGRYVWEDQRIPTAGYKGASGGIAICFSACDDDQTSASTLDFTGRMVTSAMTTSFVQAIQNQPAGLTYGRLLNVMRNAIPALAATGTNLSQEPQLSSAQKFDIYTKQFIM